MDTNIKALELFYKLYDSNSDFKLLIDKYMSTGQIRLFGDEEWEKIKSQNFMILLPNVKDFADMFLLGYNIGNCANMSRQLSFSYNDVDIVSGILPMLKGTLNAETEGGHCWLENETSIIDTSLMLIIDKNLKKEFGYIEEQRVTQRQLMSSKGYAARKEFVNDASIRK